MNGFISLESVFLVKFFLYSFYTLYIVTVTMDIV